MIDTGCGREKSPEVEKAVEQVVPGDTASWLAVAHPSLSSTQGKSERYKAQ